MLGEGGPSPSNHLPGPALGYCLPRGKLRPALPGVGGHDLRVVLGRARVLGAEIRVSGLEHKIQPQPRLGLLVSRERLLPAGRWLLRSPDELHQR